MEDMELTKRQKELIVDNYELLSTFLSAYPKKELPEYLLDDFYSDIYWIFCISALKFDGDRGFKFSTYVYTCFSRELENIKKRKKNKFKQNNYCSIEKIQKKVVKADPKIEKEFLNSFINKSGLTDREKKILVKYYYNKYTLLDIGNEYELSKERIRQIIKKALSKLRYKINNKKIEIKDFYIK